MSSSSAREPLTGLIMQGDRVVGGLNLPDPPDVFLHEFQQRYGHLGLRVTPNNLACAPGAKPESRSHVSG